MQQIMLHENISSIKRIDAREYNQQAYDRKEKLDLYKKLRSEGCKEGTILTALKISRAAYYRWKRNFEWYGLAGLENESRKPRNVRKPTWSKEIEKLVYKIRKQNPAYGKEKIAIILQRNHGHKTSISTVGRILKKLMDKGKIKSVAFVCGKKLSKARIFSGHAQRWKHGMKAEHVGELIQVDHMTVNMPGVGYVKQFSAVCPITKLSCLRLYKEATSKNAADFIEHMQKIFPFKVLSIQVDGGSEFMADFELSCQQKNIKLFVLPPKSPELNGVVERIHGTSRYEFYALYYGPNRFEDLQNSLQKFVTHYNSFRPHKNLDLLTPSQFFDTLNYRVH